VDNRSHQMSHALEECTTSLKEVYIQRHAIYNTLKQQQDSPAATKDIP